MEVNGWELLAHPLLLDQVERLAHAVEREKAKRPRDYRQGANFKLLAALFELLFVRIPADPTDSAFRQGDTLGPRYRHWFRAKFGGQRFRLFFRYDTRARVIIYAWVNDEETKRTYGSKTDAYAVFQKMLGRGKHRPQYRPLKSAGMNSL
ncbi:MAG: hypothetical protein RL653_1017 [Pseudomonadota bacterium]|jgi:toxin YhaV